MRRSQTRIWVIFLCGVICGAAIFQPASGLNQFAYDHLDATRSALEKQLNTIRGNRDNLVLRREELVSEFDKKIDTLNEYEKQVEDALRDVEYAMHQI